MSNTTRTRRKKRYREYFRDPSEQVPRTTLWRWNKTLRSEEALIGTRASTPDCFGETVNGSVELRATSSPTSDSTLSDLNSSTDVPLRTLTSPDVVEPDIPSLNNSSTSLDLTCGSDVLMTVSNNYLDDDDDDDDNNDDDEDDYDDDDDDDNNDDDNNDDDEDDDDDDNNDDDDNDDDDDDDDDVSSSDCSPNITHEQMFDLSLSSDLSEPFHSGSDISLCGAVCAVMEFCVNNKLTYNAIADLLKLLQLLCLSPNKLPISVYQLKKMFSNYTPSCYDHCKVCASCAEPADACQCTKPSFGNILTTSIDKPLEAIVTNHWEALQKLPQSSDPSMLSDIWDGTFLQELVQNNFSSSNLNLAFSLSTDGVPLFKSSSMSLWPVYLVILSLPPEVRMNSNNIMLGGLWVGPTKPPMKLLLDPILDNLRKLSTEGIMINTPNGMKTLKGKIVMGLFDLPAKAAVLCAKQFNGLYGCSVCLHPGKRLSNNARVYPPETHVLRTHAGVISAARQTLETGFIVEGIMRLSPLASELDLVSSVPIDYMHAYLEGVVKMLLNYWINSVNHGKPFYIGRQVAEIDNELMKQRPPSEFSRPPRSLEKHLKYWKASEFRNWILYYSLLLLLGKLPSLYWHHYSLLVCSLHILLKDRISLAEVDAAEKMLDDFYLLVPELYGEAACTHNVHLLSHLCKYVRLWGPLWTHSLFGYESKNGQVKHLFHGKTSIFQQLLFNVNIRVTLQLVRHHISASQVANFIDQVTHTTPRKNMTLLCEHCYIIGTTHVISLSSMQQLALQVCDDNCEVFLRLFKGGIVYYSTLYMKDRTSKRENTFCSFIIDDNIGYGQVEFFVAQPEPRALVNVFNVDASSMMETSGNPCRPQLVVYKEIDFIGTFVKPVSNSTTSNLHSINICNIIGKPVMIETATNKYLIHQPNYYEHH